MVAVQKVYGREFSGVVFTVKFRWLLEMYFTVHLPEISVKTKKLFKLFRAGLEPSSAA